jgi:hypothetical protein
MAVTPDSSRIRLERTVRKRILLGFSKVSADCTRNL